MADYGSMISGGAGGVAGIWGGVAGILAGRKNLDIARKNAAYMRMRAEDAVSRAELETRDVRTEANKRVSQGKVAYAAQGVSVDSAVTVEATEGQLVQSQFVQDRLRANAAIEAWGYRTQAELTEDAGEAQYRAAQLNAYGQFLQGGASLATIPFAL